MFNKFKAFMKPSGAKISQFYSHVVVVKNINNVVENKLANPDKIRENASFFFAPKSCI
jgi:hypothetical protein